MSKGNTWHGYSSRGHSRPRSVPSWWLPRVAPCVQSGEHVKPVDVDHVSWPGRVASVSTWWWRRRPDSCVSRRPDSPPESHRPPASANAWWRVTDGCAREKRYLAARDKRENKRPHIPPRKYDRCRIRQMSRCKSVNLIRRVFVRHWYRASRNRFQS